MAIFPRPNIWRTVLPALVMCALAGCVVPPVPPPAAPSPPPEAPPVEAPPPAPPGPPRASSDQDFINQAVGMNASEIGMGRLARAKAASPAVRALAARMIADYTIANRHLDLLAKRLQLVVTPLPDRPPPELLLSTGPAFDTAYLGLVVTGHQSMIALFESEANDGQDTRAKHFAREMLPLLRHHLQEVEAIGHKAGV